MASVGLGPGQQAAKQQGSRQYTEVVLRDALAQPLATLIDSKDGCLMTSNIFSNRRLVMTAAFASDQRLENGAEQLESLRRQMALLSEKVSGGPAVRATWCRRDRCRCPRGRWECCRVRGLLSMVASVTAAGGNAVIGLASRISG